jgi:transcriptional regulator with XRE-family HTH domain
MKISNKVGLRIRELRRIAGLTQAELAEVANLSNNYIGAIERGQRSPALETIDKIAIALKVPVYELFIFGRYKRNKVYKATEELIKKVSGKKADDIYFAAEILESVLQKLDKTKKK